MKAEGLKFFTDVVLTQMGLMLFFLSFLAILIKTYLRHSKDHYNTMAQKPFEGE